MNHAYLLVNFGGPRSLKEIEPFLCELLTDKDVVRTKWPQLVHNFLFRNVAKKRSARIAKDYISIGGKSPIFSDTEWVASSLEQKINVPVFTFHRYLPSTHRASLEALESADYKEFRVFPMFPQFTFATTGSVARFFMRNLSQATAAKLKWIKSYPSHPAFIYLLEKMIREFLAQKNLLEEEMFFLFSAHGLPKAFVEEGDPYEKECNISYRKIIEKFPGAKSILAFQSKFGRGEWLRPYTQELCENIENYAQGRKHVLFIPISFTSDHIETLFEIQQQYMPLLLQKGYSAYRLPAMNRRPDWVEAVEKILQIAEFYPNNALVRK